MANFGPADQTMPNEVSPQVDIGQLTLRGLGSFTPLLATLTADDVNPMAMIQMENLGAVFPINGEYARQVPDLLQRCTSSRLDRLGLVLGWRKGDSASLMAKSAGGQAISLLATCLMSLFSDRSGDILLGLSQKTLPASITVSSGSQLKQVAEHLSTKLAVLGFGNLLARQVSWIHSVYEQLQKPVPTDLLEVMTTDSVVDLLHAISRALREDDLLVRISGTQATGYILGLAMMMFPHDTLVTVCNLVVYEGQRKAIIIELNVDDQPRPTDIRLETVLTMSQTVSLPIAIEPRDPKVLTSTGYFKWEGWVADRLQLVFLDQGIKCSKDLCIACSCLLILLPAAIKGTTLFSKDHPLPEIGLVYLLGSYPHHRMTQICQQLFRIPPIQSQDSIERAYEELVHVFRSNVKGVSCSCGATKARCNLLQGWSQPSDKSKYAKGCKLRILWEAVGYALDNGLVSFFIEAGVNATVRDHKWGGSGLATEFLTKFRLKECYYISCQNIHYYIMTSIIPYADVSNDLARSNSSTFYPSLLRRMALHQDNLVYYELLDGKLQLNGRYHMVLRNRPVSERNKATRSLYAHKNLVKPSCLGEHSNLLLTVHERSDGLELRCVARCSGINISLNLTRVIVASYGLKESEQCDHSRTDPLSSDRLADIVTTSVATPRAQGKKISVVQTAGNETAQLLGCELGVPAIIQKNSCLNCAYDEAKDKFKMIIVG